MHAEEAAAFVPITRGKRALGKKRRENAIFVETSRRALRSRRGCGGVSSARLASVYRLSSLFPALRPINRCFAVSLFHQLRQKKQTNKQTKPLMWVPHQPRSCLFGGPMHTTPLRCFFFPFFLFWRRDADVGRSLPLPGLCILVVLEAAGSGSG